MLCLWLLRVHLICVSLLYLRAAVDYFVLLAILGRPLLLPRAAYLPHGRAAWLVCVVCKVWTRVVRVVNSLSTQWKFYYSHSFE